MTTKLETATQIDYTAEVAEWIEAFDEVVASDWEHSAELLGALRQRAREAGVPTPGELTTPYRNTIPKLDEVPYPGDRTLERRVESLIRWNAMAMVHSQNKKDPGIGGHISTYSSLATLLEVGFNHFFHAKYGDLPGDFIYFQGHASPGVYARAYLEGRFDDDRLKNFRHELRDTPGLSSYPHPWLMSDFWNFPTVSMGIGPLNAIYQARFMKYLEHRGLIPASPRKVWAFVGDGETDEVDTLGAISLGARENLDNLIFVVNCNLQRLDGPVRGNKRIIDELEGVFTGAGWNVIKVIWGSDWDALFERDHTGLLLRRMEECVDGDFQTFKAKDGAYLREHFFGKYPELLALVKDMTDDQLANLHRGGHDPAKIYNAYKRAIEHKGTPTVILAKTVKGYGLGSAQARNATHSEKKLADDALAQFVKRFDIPVPEEAAKNGAFYRPAQDSPEIAYMQQRRQELGGYLPSRNPPKLDFQAPALDYFNEWLSGSKGRAVSTTMVFINILKHLLKDPTIGKLIVPIVPDEGRTFGLESVIRQVAIYAPEGQKYTPHDADMLLYYREAQDGQILEEGITEAGSMASFTAAGTAYSNHGVPTIPFYMYYSMFGFQRIGDMVWAFADSRGKGFLMAAPQAARPCWAKDCSIRTATRSCSQAPSPPASPTIPPTPSSSPSCCRTASAACTRRTKTSSTTSPCTTRTTPCPRCRKAARRASLKACTNSAPPPTARPWRNSSAAVPSSTRCSARRRSSPTSTASPLMYGAFPATPRSVAMPSPSSVGTACTPPSPSASRISKPRSKARLAPSLRPATT